MKSNVTLHNLPWRKKFLYPFALDYTVPLTVHQDGLGTTRINTKNLKESVDFLDSKQFQFPISAVGNKEEFLQELQKPITLTIEELIRDLYKFTKEFPIEVIPHVNEDKEIVDNIHMYQRAKSENIALDRAKPTLKQADIHKALKEIYTPEIARYIGLIAHLVYWTVFGHMN